MLQDAGRGTAHWAHHRSLAEVIDMEGLDTLQEGALDLDLTCAWCGTRQKPTQTQPVGRK